MTSTKFRSILPHEPLLSITKTSHNYNNKVVDDHDEYGNTSSHNENDNNSNDNAGYVILQGSFETKQQQQKQKNTKQPQQQQEQKQINLSLTIATRDCNTKPDIESDGENQNHVTATSLSSTSSLGYYWKTKESLQHGIKESLCQLLSTNTNNHHKISSINDSTTKSDNDVSSNSSNQYWEWYLPIEINILTPEPPYTKVQLKFTSNYMAYHFIRRFKKNILTPFILFSNYSHNNNGNVISNSSNIIFSIKPFQITPITDKLLLSNDICWNRSNPPKFIRNKEEIKQQYNTRFLVLETNLNYAKIDNNNNNNDDQWWKKYLMNDPYALQQAIRSLISNSKFDDTSNNLGIEVFVHYNKGQLILDEVYIGMRSYIDAQRVLVSLQNQLSVQYTFDIIYDDGTYHNITVSTTKPIFIGYVTISENRSISSVNTPDGASSSIGEVTRSEDTNTTDDIIIPGLQIIENYISIHEESLLMAALNGPLAPWAPPQKTISNPNAYVKRNVQHYGYVFNYQTNHIMHRSNNDYNNTNETLCPPLLSLPNDYYDNDILHEKNNNMMTVTNSNDNITSNDNKNSNENNNEGCTRENIDTLSEEKEQSKKEQKILDTYCQQCVKDGRGWELLAGIIEKVRHFQSSHDDDHNNNDNRVSFQSMNQMTINEYKPGQGIGSHVETISAFADGVISISLNSGIVMEFRQVSNNDEHDDDDGDDSKKTTKKRIMKKKLVYLPPRSLLCITGEARYLWEHGIVTRTTDTHQNQVIPRKLRISLTLRTAIDTNGIPLPIIRSNQYPPIWGIDIDKMNRNNSDGTTTNNNSVISNKTLITPDCERDHVHAVYDAIAKQWNHTRGKRGVLWPGATTFLQTIQSGSIIADVGCGDGKYFPIIWENGSYVIGTDISEPLLQTAKEEGDNFITPTENRKVSSQHQYLKDHPAIIVADCLNIPLCTNSCDAAICIAVLHHISTEERRIRCIEELVRIVKSGGYVNVQAWAMEQDINSKRQFVSNDIFVPFNAQPKYLQWNHRNQSVVTNTTNDMNQNNQNPISINHNDSDHNGDTTFGDDKKLDTTMQGKSTAQLYSERYKNVEYDDKKGLVVFKRYCHLYRKGELDMIASKVPGVNIVESGFESGNYYIIFQVIK